MATVRGIIHKKESNMATVRDTEQTIAFIEGRGWLDPTTLSFANWVTIIESAVSVMSPKHLHGFRAAQDIVSVPMFPRGRKVDYSYHAPPARIWLGLPGASWEMDWFYQYIVCGTRCAVDSGDWPKEITQTYLLFGKDSEFVLLDTRWLLEGNKYCFSNNTNDGHLRVQHVKIPKVAQWCFEDTENGPYLLRAILEHFTKAAEETESDLIGKLKRASEQCRALKQRLSAISWVKPGDNVWVVSHSHSFDRQLENEYHPTRRQVIRLKNELVQLEYEGLRSLWNCYRTEEDCRAACPAPHADD